MKLDSLWLYAEVENDDNPIVVPLIGNCVLGLFAPVFHAMLQYAVRNKTNCCYTIRA